MFAAFLGVWLATFLILILGLHDDRVLEYLFLLGGFATSASFMYTMCFRLRPDDHISPTLLVAVFVIGGFVGATLTTFPDTLISHTPLNSLLVGPVEEFCTIVIVVIVARWIPVKNARVGLFIGGAVGFGFAGFENALYGFGAFFEPPAGNGPLALLVQNEALRSVTTMLGHPIWTSILAAAVYAAYRDNHLRVTRHVIGAFLVVAALHDLWDATGPIWAAVLGPTLGAFLVEQTSLLVVGLVGVFVWWRVARGANADLPTQPAPTSAKLA